MTTTTLKMLETMVTIVARKMMVMRIMMRTMSRMMKEMMREMMIVQRAMTLVTVVVNLVPMTVRGVQALVNLQLRVKITTVMIILRMCLVTLTSESIMVAQSSEPV